MSEHSDYEKSIFERSVNMTKTHGILSIVFGSLGAFIGLIMVLVFSVTITDFNSYQVMSAFFTAFLVFLLGVLPHVYLLISGITLLKAPAPNVAKPLIIINLIVGVLWNIVILIFAIINLTQMGDYERGYGKHHKK